MPDIPYQFIFIKIEFCKKRKSQLDYAKRRRKDAHRYEKQLKLYDFGFPLPIEAIGYR